MHENKEIKICVIALGLFGDVLLRTPILKALKLKYPNSKITAIADSIGYEILKNSEFVDEIITLYRRRDKILKYLYSKISVQIMIIAKRFDLMIDLYNGRSSKKMAKLSFAKKVVKNKKERNFYNFKNPKHLTAGLFETIQEVEFDKSMLSLVPNFTISKYAKNSYGGKNYLVSLGSGDLKKILSFDKTLALIKHIYDNFLLAPAIIQNPGQEFLQADFIENYLKPAKIPFVKLERLNIDDLALAIKNTKFIIVPDTGILHLSFALKTPAFCVFTHTHPVLIAPEDESVILGVSFTLKEPSEYDLHGIRVCSGNIPVQKIKADFDEFIKRVEILT